jgi:hypothetical protein
MTKLKAYQTKIVLFSIFAGLALGLFQNFDTPINSDFFAGSDIIFSKRRHGMDILAYDPRTIANPKPTDVPQSINALDAATTYSANRLVWHYADQTDFMTSFQNTAQVTNPSDAVNCGIHLHVRENQSADLQCKQLIG